MVKAKKPQPPAFPKTPKPERSKRLRVVINIFEFGSPILILGVYLLLPDNVRSSISDFINSLSK